jgi:uncharacterized protein YqjF (DUF2071 family)
MERRARPFMTAQWLNLAVVNFEIDPRVLGPFVPEGTELDLWHGRALVSLVGFQFRDIRVLGFGVPFHRRFNEVNLRFYVRRQMPTGWRRGVVFIREVAPRRAVAWVARTLYGENYVTARVEHHMECDANSNDVRAVEYSWRHGGGDVFRLAAKTQGRRALASPASEAEFIIEHYWGYSGGPDRPTIEYRVEHPRWKLWPAKRARFRGNAASLYGKSFAETLAVKPTSAFFADGSAVAVYRG